MTSDLNDFIYSRPWPSGNRLIFDVETVEFVGNLYHPHLAFTLYRDNFNLFTKEEQMHIAAIFQEIHKKIRDSGVPTTLEVKESVHER